MITDKTVYTSINKIKILIISLITVYYGFILQTKALKCKINYIQRPINLLVRTQPIVSFIRFCSIRCFLPTVYITKSTNASIERKKIISQSMYQDEHNN